MTAHYLDAVLDAREARESAGRHDRSLKVDTITERAGPGAPAGETAACDAVSEWLGLTWPCDQPSIGLYRRICVHEHVRDGRLCQGHADAAAAGLCQTCHDLSGGLGHECPISITELTS